MEQEVYEGLLLLVLAAGIKKVKAGLEYAASDEGMLELGAALDAIDMLACDILHFVEINAGDCARSEEES